VLDPAILNFFDERKKAWLRKNIKISMGEEKIKEIEIKCEEEFSLEYWLPKAAKRAKQISISTHPCTFSHPSARKNKNGYVSSVIANATFKQDGFLKSGNVAVDRDALGNAAALDVYKFLTLDMEDGQNLLTHIQKETELARKLLNITSTSAEILTEGFLAMTENTSSSITSSKIKQVYFPVEDDYHQLSLLTNSGMVFQLKQRINVLRFSGEVKELREIKQKNEFSNIGFSEIYNLTTIGYGGTKPQNISVLNNQNGGKAHLLSSLPPSIEKRSVNFPKSNFFIESFRKRDYLDVFQALHKILKIDYNNINIREGRDYRIQELIDRIINKMWTIRAVSGMQYFEEYSQLKIHQKIWLCDDFKKERESSDIWLGKLIKEISNWIIRTYEKTMGKQAIKLGPEEQLIIHQIVTRNKEALR
jgi:CRISPR-associated protein Csy1